jgi:hypothetical protein
MNACTRIAAIATLLLLGCASTVTAVGCVPISPTLGGATQERHFPPWAPRVRLLPSPSHADVHRSELKAIDFGEVVAAEHYDVTGVVAMSMLKGLRTSDVKITLVVNGGQSIATRVKPDGSFALLDVPPGSHLLETFALGYSFPPMTVRINPDGVIKAEYAEDPTVWFESPLILKPVSTATYFEPRQNVSLGSLMKNPMFLMVAFTVLMAWAMPKIMEGMDPEELKEMQEKMGAQPSMGDLFSGKMFEDAKKQAEEQAKKR